ETIKREEEGFNKTLDRGIELFEREVARILGSARGSRASVGGSPTEAHAGIYSKRRLPHFERPWSKYAITFSTVERRTLSPAARNIVLDCILHWGRLRYELYAACVMPDHVHMLIEPAVSETRADGSSV